MPSKTPIIAWARSPVAPLGSALAQLSPHELGRPLLLSLLQQSGLPAHAVDAVVVGNALGAGGNPARMLALASGLPDGCAAHTIDTQCCSGLDAVAMAVGLLQSGQAEVVIAGGIEAWSRAPIRQTRPLLPGEQPQSYERPPFAPEPARDPDMLQSAADYALTHGFSRSRQEQYALLSHSRALAAQAQLAPEIVPVAGLVADAYPRALQPARAARMPVLARGSCEGASADDIAAHALSPLTVSAKADGAALILLATPEACARWNLQPRAQWLASASVGAAPETPLLAAIAAAQMVLARGSHALAGPHNSPLLARDLSAIELHDAFAVQGLAFCTAMGLAPEQINSAGGGLARGHPIGASGAIALVRCLAQLEYQARSSTPKAGLGLATIAGAGGIGAATLVQWLQAAP
ncbi:MULTISPECIES: thiolase family protein [Comamonas]|uniref:thiolase family protein n=1 Tax=Comamonas TaxID=283 RepID=UPI00050F373E|nr:MULTISPECIES: thiolase family protein [Comamonas]KGG91829.1 acetyl-CoA acetyltransferase [Comamonas thiooxydans]KGG95336.1 acetyl-CoA acetyltransferase [Comamonas thiooxydans]KGH07908.1 acetyl-CoA acetyltransferase [Comamonas thiooxydans]KGH15437.1 acetyl-CoA acetyltransferase [Comamonas thiooxydans]TZG07177.1 thiolase family protein [Comamonas thiooxydans]